MLQAVFVWLKKDFRALDRETYLQFEKLVAGFTEQYTRENRFIRKNGSVTWVNLSVSAVRDSHRQVKHLVAVIEDIQERKQSEQARFLLASIVESSPAGMPPRSEFSASARKRPLENQSRLLFLAISDRKKRRF